MASKKKQKPTSLAAKKSYAGMLGDVTEVLVNKRWYDGLEKYRLLHISDCSTPEATCLKLARNFDEMEATSVQAEQERCIELVTQFKLKQITLEECVRKMKENQVAKINQRARVPGNSFKAFSDKGGRTLKRKSPLRPGSKSSHPDSVGYSP